MQEKDLKVKQKQSTIKTKDGKNNGKKQKASPLKEKMKADYIRTKTRQPTEKETSEASKQAEETIEDAAMETGIYVVGRIVSGKKSKKEKQYIFDEDLQSKAEAGEFVWNPEGNKKAVKKKYAVEKGRRIKEKQPARKEAEFPKTVIFQEQQIYNRRSDERKKYQNLKMTKEKIPQKLQKTLQKRSQYQREGKWHAVKSLRETLFFQKTPKTAKQINDGNRFTKAIANTVTAFVKGILAALGGLSGLIIVFVIIGAVLALVSTAFGVFFSAYDDTAGTRRIAEIVAETNSEFYAKVSEIENEVPHDTVEYHVVPDGGDQLFITNWTEVVAVFAAKTAGAGEDATDVVTMDDARVELLKEVFWDMNELSYKTEKVKHGSGEDTEMKTILHITLTSRGYEEMVDYYDFTLYQKQALYELMQPEYAQMLSELVGTLGVAGESIELTSEQVQKMLENLPEGLSPERRAVVELAYSLVGKVNYFWGGKSEVIGWDSRWGTPTKVTAAGSSTTGMTLPFGLDCSGFVTWVFINAMGDPSYANVIGHGASNQYGKCKKISWSEALPGDLVFYPDLGHVGVIVGIDENGNLLVAHCASSQNNVVVTGVQGFTKIGRRIL
ncbi:NlpC/P60 family protein [Anaerotignum sp.]